MAAYAKGVLGSDQDCFRTWLFVGIVAVLARDGVDWKTPSRRPLCTPGYRNHSHTRIAREEPSYAGRMNIDYVAEMTYLGAGGRENLVAWNWT